MQFPKQLLWMLCLLLSAASVLAQSKSIKGKVTDTKTNSPLEGATVSVVHSRTNTVSKADGTFEINIPAGKTSLIVSFVGYQTKTVTVGPNENNITVALLQSAASQLNDVVVVGYGTQKKVNLTGAVASITSKALTNRPVTSLGNALQGTMAGVTVTSSASGQPGSDAGTIRIRGIGTLNNANPVIVIDGVITTLNNLNNINSDDIASISVLKDAASAAIYGSRAANGVILITTKLGKKGTSQIAYNMYVGKQKANGLPNFLPSWQAATLYNQALENEGKTPRWTDDEIQKFKDGSDPYNYPNTDWLGLFYQGNGIQQNHYLGINGGNDKTLYSLSLGLFNENGLVKKTNAIRYTARYNVQSQVTDNLSVTGNLALTYSSQRQPTNPYTGDFTQLVRQIDRISSTIPYKFENGYYGYITDGSPMAWLEGRSEQNSNYYDLLGNLGADWQPVKNLHFRPSISYVMKVTHSKNFIADQQYYDADGNETFYQGPSSVTDANSFMNTVTMQSLIDYSKSFGNHNFKILGGYSQEYNKYTYDNGYRKNFLNNLLTDVNLGSTDGQTTSGYSYELALQSYFGRLNYDYNGKYLLEANLRYDGSSRFASNNRWGLFPSFSMGWNIDKEKFFTDLTSTVSSLKLRGSWGKLGNQTLNSNLSIDQQYYPYTSVVAASQNYIFGGVNPVIAAGVSPVDGANADIKWETTRETDIGIDAGFLKNKMTLTVDYFDKVTNGILLSIPVSASYGLTAPVQNAAKIANKGWEFTVGYNGSFKDFTYNITANTTLLENKVTDLHGTGPIISGYTYYDVGVPFYSFYGYKAIGIFQSDNEVAKAPYQKTTTAAGDLRYADLDGNDTINSKDRTNMGTYFPKVTFGLTFSAQWKGIDISIFLQGAASVKNYTDLGKIGAVSSSAGKPTTALLNTWTPENTSASLPRIWYSYAQNDPSGTPSSFWVKDGSYL
jgi:TonB-linked SusC/RagA family outer membrane protein